jgi:hypothetical protein
MGIKPTKTFTDEKGNWWIEFNSDELKKALDKYKQNRNKYSQFEDEKNNKDMEQKPFKLTVQHWDTIITIEKDHSDVDMEELHEMWLSMVKAMGFFPDVIKEFYKE